MISLLAGTSHGVGALRGQAQGTLVAHGHRAARVGVDAHGRQRALLHALSRAKGAPGGCSGFTRQLLAVCVGVEPLCIGNQATLERAERLLLVVVVILRLAHLLLLRSHLLGRDLTSQRSHLSILLLGKIQLLATERGQRAIVWRRRTGFTTHGLLLWQPSTVVRPQY